VGPGRLLITLGGALAATAWIGCAHAPATTPAPLVVEAAALTAPARVELPAVPLPTDHPEARRALELGFGALEGGQYPMAAAQFRAVLLTDFLTDAGRMNIYWFTAEAHSRFDDRDGERDALEGFLLAAEQVALPNEDVLARAMHARSVLASLKLAESADFGRSPESPIVVEDPREPASIVASLACGPEGKGRFVAVDEEAVVLEHSQLVHRRVSCYGSTQTMDLWFDVTHMGSGPRRAAFEVPSQER